MDEGMLNSIQILADDQKISVNALLLSMIEYYINIANYGKNIGLMHIGHPNLKLLLEHINADSFNNTPLEDFRDTFEIWVELKDMKRDLPSLLKMLKLHDNMGWAIIKTIKQSNNGYKIMFSHQLGQVWTAFLRKWFESGYEYMVGTRLSPDDFNIMSNGFSVNIPPSSPISLHRSKGVSSNAKTSK